MSIQSLGYTIFFYKHLYVTIEQIAYNSFDIDCFTWQVQLPVGSNGGYNRFPEYRNKRCPITLNPHFLRTAIL